MIQKIKMFNRKRKIVERYGKRSGIEIFNKRKEVHEAYLTANRQKQKEVEEFHRGQLNMIDWMVKNGS